MLGLAGGVWVLIEEDEADYGNWYDRFTTIDPCSRIETGLQLVQDHGLA